jgi:hypothetical protein
MLRINPMSKRAVRFVQLGIPALLGATVLVITGCRDPVSTVGTSVELTQPVLTADQNWVRSSFDVDNTVFVPCLRENVRFFGPVPFQFHTVRTTSGTFNSKFQLRPGAVSPPFFGHALASGTLYEFANGGTYNETFHSAAGEVFRFKIHETYLSEGGDRLEASAFVHVTINANGDVTVQKIEPFAFTCVDK